MAGLFSVKIYLLFLDSLFIKIISISYHSNNLNNESGVNYVSC